MSEKSIPLPCGQTLNVTTDVPMNMVIVIDCKDKETCNFVAVKAFLDTPEGNQQAESLFREWMKDMLADSPNAATDEDYENAISDGLYEQGDGYIALVHTT